MDWEQIENVSMGMRGLDPELQKDVRRAVISAQFRHRGAQALRSVWRCFKEDNDKGLNTEEVTRCFCQ